MYVSFFSYNLAAWLTKGPNKQKNLETTEATVRDLLDKHGIGTLQEGGSYQKMLIKLRKEGHGLYWGPKDGSEFGMRATPIIWHKEFRYRVFESDTKLLVKALRIAPGAGPTLIKPKYVHRVTAEVNGRRVHFLGIHGYASLSVKLRWPWAKRFFTRLAEYIDDLDGLVVLGGDFNTNYKDRWMKPLFDVGMESLQQEFGPFVTHQKDNRGKGSTLDDILYRYAPYRLRGIGLRVTQAISDHHSLAGIFVVRPTNVKFKRWQELTGVSDPKIKG